MRKQKRTAEELEKFAAEPVTISEEDWRREIDNAALRRVMADASIQESTKIAFRRHVRLGEPAMDTELDSHLTTSDTLKQSAHLDETVIRPGDDIDGFTAVALSSSKAPATSSCPRSPVRTST